MLKTVKTQPHFIYYKLPTKHKLLQAIRNNFATNDTFAAAFAY